jgi:quercetin dioxygenase-like cupin family protein
MTVISGSEAKVHELFGVRFTNLASPSKGTTENSMWQTEVPPGSPVTPHQVTREELVYVLAGEAHIHIGDTVTKAAPGDVAILPADTDVAVENAGDGPLRLLAILPVAGRARIDGEEATLPWML